MMIWIKNKIGNHFEKTYFYKPNYLPLPKCVVKYVYTFEKLSKIRENAIIEFPDYQNKIRQNL